MANINTKIEWTDATWSPVTGCTKVSQGCKNCYAERVMGRFNPGRAFTDVRCHPERLDAPLHWKKPRRVFVNSMSDLFHEDVPIQFIGSVLGIAAAASWHRFQVLTKRPQRMLDVLASSEFDCAFEESNDMATHTEHVWPPANIWLGVSVEDQVTADERIPLLLQTPAAVRFISAEPLLGPVSLRWLAAFDGQALKPRGAGVETNELDGLRRLDWVIAGGESGPNARPSHPDWFRVLRDQCAVARVPFFFKQWGEWVSLSEVEGKGPHHYFDDTGAGVRRVGKKAAGRTLDGRIHDEFPA